MHFKINRSHILPSVSSKGIYTGDGRPNRSTTSRTQTQGPHSHKCSRHIPKSSNSNSTSTSKTKTKSNGTTNRPTDINRQNSVQTRYMNMLLSLDTIPRMHNILISFFNWILLAGFVIFPGTFTSLESLPPSSTPSPTTTHLLLTSIKHIPLLVIGSICCFLGASGMIYLWYSHRTNYIWLLNKIFLPGCLNGATGLVGTMVAVYSQQKGDWSVTARVTVIVEGCVMGVCGGVFGVYNFWKLRRVRGRHEGVVGGLVREGDGDGEGLVEKIRRKRDEPALEPGSVV